MNRFCRTPYPASSFTMFSMPTGWGYRGGLLPLPIIGGAFNMVRHEPSAAELSSLLLWLAGYQSHPDKPFKKPTVEDCYTFCGPPDGRNRFCTLSLLLFRFIPPPRISSSQDPDQLQTLAADTMILSSPHEYGVYPFNRVSMFTG